MSVTYNSSIVKDGLVLCLDAGNTKSYPGTGTTWFDLSGMGYNMTVVAAAYNSSGPKYMDFNGSYGCAKAASGVDIPILNGAVTACVWTIPLNSTGNWRTLFRGLSTGGDHQVIIQSAGWDIGMYDNTNGTGYNGTGFSQQSLPGYPTQWNMMTWRWRSGTPSYTLTYNDSPDTIRGSIASGNAAFKSGICSIGAHNNVNQTDPNTCSQFWGSISYIFMYNRCLSDAEVRQNFYATKARFGM